MSFSKVVTSGLMMIALESCNASGCSEYSSQYPCSYVEEKAEYEVWYWRNLERDDESDNVVIGRAIGLRMCEGNARSFADAIKEPFNYRAYICVLMKDGERMEKHRLLST
jgi:hypothetical protein